MDVTGPWAARIKIRELDQAHGQIQIGRDVMKRLYRSPKRASKNVGEIVKSACQLIFWFSKQYHSWLSSLSFSILWNVSCNRKFEAFVTANKPIGNSAEDNGKQDRTCVVHVRCGDRKHGRERHPDDHEYKVHQGEHIDGNTPFAEAERTICHRWTANLP